VLVLICFCFTLHTPHHSASDFSSHRGVTIPTSFYTAAISRFWRYCHWKNFQFQSSGWKIHFVIEKNQFRGECCKHLYQNELEVGLLPTPSPLNHVKIFKGWPHRDASAKLVQLWYKTFPQDKSGLIEMKNPTRFSNKTSTTWSCAEDQILVDKISGTGS